MHIIKDALIDFVDEVKQLFSDIANAFKKGIKKIRDNIIIKLGGATEKEVTDLNEEIVKAKAENKQIEEFAQSQCDLVQEISKALQNKIDESYELEEEQEKQIKILNDCFKKEKIALAKTLCFERLDEYGNEYFRKELCTVCSNAEKCSCKMLGCCYNFDIDG